MLRISLFGPPNLSDYRASGSHTAGTLCAIALAIEKIIKNIKKDLNLY
jgi:hypothetical protein